MGLCGWIIFGFFAGLVARAVMPGTQAMGFVRTTILGVLGSFAGGFVYTLIKGGNPMDLRPSSFLGSVAGALLILWLGAMASRRR